jgi:hypothetical protein
MAFEQRHLIAGLSSGKPGQSKLVIASEAKQSSKSARNSWIASSLRSSQ